MNPCTICKREFGITKLLQSKQDEFFCQECFKNYYCCISQKSKRKMLNPSCEGDSPIRNPRKMFTLEDLRILRSEREKRAQKVQSKRPLQCPHGDCKKSVSVFELMAHFQHEHLNVKISETFLDVRNPLSFCPKNVNFNTNQCVALLNLIPIVEEEKNQLEKSTNSIALAVLVSRVCCLDPDDNSETVGGQTNQDSRLILWASSNVPCNFSYTIAVSTINEDIRIKYYGPVLQLGADLEELWRRGHCLILDHYHYLGMTDHGRTHLNLDVIVHSED